MNKVDLKDLLNEEKSENLIKQIGLKYQYELMDVDYLINLEPMISKMNGSFIRNMYLDDKIKISELPKASTSYISSLVKQVKLRYSQPMRLEGESDIDFVKRLMLDDAYISNPEVT